MALGVVCWLALVCELDGGSYLPVGSGFGQVLERGRKPAGTQVLGCHWVKIRHCKWPKVLSCKLIMTKPWTFVAHHTILGSGLFACLVWRVWFIFFIFPLFFKTVFTTLKSCFSSEFLTIKQKLKFKSCIGNSLPRFHVFLLFFLVSWSLF